MEEEDPYRLGLPVLPLRPPGLTVVGSGAADPLVDIRTDRIHLIVVEDVAEMEEASLLEEAQHLLPVVVGTESAVEVEGTAIDISEGDVAAFVDLPAVQERAEHRLPCDPVVDGSRRDADLRGHGESHGGLDVLEIVRQRLLGQDDHDLGAVGPRPHLKGSARFGERHAPVVDVEAERRSSRYAAPRPARSPCTASASGSRASSSSSRRGRGCPEPGGCGNRSTLDLPRMPNCPTGFHPRLVAHRPTRTRRPSARRHRMGRESTADGRR